MSNVSGGRSFSEAKDPNKIEKAFARQKPVLIAGMHRSGTSILADILQSSGLFLGDRQIPDLQESLLFVRINNEIFSQCFATWNNPFGIHLALNNPENTRGLAGFAMYNLNQNPISFLGEELSEKYAGIENADFVWGWKDPRNTFTLPVWQRIFPELKVIFIYRHGIDVAESFYQRHIYALSEIYPEKDVPALVVEEDEIGLSHARRGWTREEALTLWEEYMEKGMEYYHLNRDRFCLVQYESLMQRPQETIAPVLEFCGLDEKKMPKDKLREINAGRCYAYLNNPELKQFAKEKRHICQRFGYEV